MRALDHQHGRWVALKIRPAPDPTEREALLGEARILLSLRPHPNLPLVREDFFWDDRYVLVMDWVDGVDLAHLVTDTGDPGLPVTSVVSYLAQAAEALGHLHAQGVVHGDVKPANLVLAPDGRLVLVDFGVSRRPGDEAGDALGSPGYSPPELGAGLELTSAADVYSLAATAVALLTGAPPSDGRPDWEGVPNAAAIERALRRGLATDPDRRPRTAAELLERLRAHLALDLPSGVVTFLLSDIEGSTVLWEQDADAMADVLAHHDAFIADAVESNGGRLLKTRGEGDATFSVFARASDAVGAALAAQREIVERIGLGVRMAIHTGEAQVRDGDYFGRTVNRAARLRAFGSGGQILLSSAAADLVADALPAGVSLDDLGEQTLRDLPRPERVYALRYLGAAAAAAAARRPVIRAEGRLPIDAPTAPPGTTHAPRSAPPAPPALPAALTAGRTNFFVGRRAELDRMTAAWGHARAGSRRLVLVAGEPGIGKTRLAAETAAMAQADGGLVLHGRCDEGLGVPYQPFVSALAQTLAAAPPGTAPELGRLPSELTRLVPEVGAVVAGLPPPLRSDPETEQYRLFDAVAGWLQATGEVAPVVLVLDDLHWATRPTLHLLRHVVRMVEPARLLVVGTYRDTELDRDHPLAELLADLGRVPAYERLSLSGLSTDDVVALLEAGAGHPLGGEGRALAQTIHAETNGNAFFVREVVRHLVETGAIVEEGGEWRVAVPLSALAVPEGVREVVARRLARLSDGAHRVLEVAAIVGLEFGVDVLQEASAAGEDATLTALDEAAAARLLFEAAPMRYRFAHALVRATLLDGLGSTRRIVTHRRVGEAIERLYARRLDDHLPELAYHFAEATPGSDGTKAVEYATRAGDLALERLAHDEAIAYYTMATELLPTTVEPVDEQRRCRLLITLGEAQRRAGHPDYRQTLLDAAAVAARWRDPVLLADAALANSRSSFSAVGEVDEARVGVLETALDLVSPADSDVRARLLAHLAVELAFSVDWPRRIALSDEAVAMARRLDDPATLAQVLVLRSPTIWHASTLAERLALAEEQAALADELDDPTLALHAAVNGVHAAFEAGRFDLAESRLARAEALARELGQPTLRWVVMFLRARWAAVHGEFEEAEALATEALSLGEAAGQPDAFAAFAAQLFMIRTFQGRLGEIVDLVSQAATANPDLPGFQAALAHCYIELGRPDDARPAYERLAAADFAALPHNMTWIVGATVGAYVAARLGDGPRAVQLLGLLEPYRSQFASDRPTWGGSVAYYCGLLAACLEEWDAADDFLTEAAAAHERLGAVPLLALTRVDHASVLLARCGPGDDDRAHALLAEAEAAAAASGLEAVKRWSAALVEREAARTPATPGAGVEDGREEQP